MSSTKVTLSLVLMLLTCVGVCNAVEFNVGGGMPRDGSLPMTGNLNMGENSLVFSNGTSTVTISGTGTPWTAMGYLTNLVGVMTNLTLTTNAPGGSTFSDGILYLGTNAGAGSGASTNCIGVGVWLMGDSGGTSTLKHITSGGTTNLIGSFIGL